MNTKRIFNMVMIATILLSALAWQPSGRKVLAEPNGATLYVKPGGTGDCSAWDKACDLQAALAASVSGDEIWVAAGTYKPTATTDRTISFALETGVAIYGGFAGTETERSQRDWQVNKAVLSGDIGNLNNNSDNSYHVVTITGVSGVVLDGFTITGGNANGANPNDVGGGIFNMGGSPILAKLTISGNMATSLGGGAFLGLDSPTLTSVTFSNNRAEDAEWGYGGGLYNAQNNATLTNVIFSDNYATYVGGGMVNQASNPTLTNVTFSDNKVDRLTGSYGGGMYNNQSSPTLNYVTFIGNQAGSGAGMYNQFDSKPTLTNVIFSGNRATSVGGGMDNEYRSAAKLTSVSFYGNQAGSGAGMNNNNSHVQLTNVIFLGNNAGSGGGMSNGSSDPVLINVTFYSNLGGGIYDSHSSSPTLTNVIMWNNIPQQIDHNSINNPTPVSVTYSDIEGGYAGTGNKNVDPQFEDPFSANLHLRIVSPLIDAGSNAALPAGTTGDLDGNVRIVDGNQDGTATVDMGAYEAQIFQPGQNIIYVDRDSTGTVHNGSSWANALLDLQAGLAAASTGNQVWVAEGIYYPALPGPAKATFQIKDGVKLYGGFAGTENDPGNRDWNAHRTVLSGDIDRDDTLTGNVYHVVTASGAGAETELNGFTITAGNANGSGVEDKKGGGMVASNSSPTLNYVTFSGNSAANFGGGMASVSSVNGPFTPTLINSVFSANAAGQYGSGLYISSLCNARVINSVFYANTSSGAVIYSENSSPTLTNTIVWGNTASDPPVFGGSVSFSDTQGHPIPGGTSNIHADPLFVDADGPDNIPGTPDDNLRLQPDSPAIDTGNRSAVPGSVTKDLAGRPRFFSDANLDGQIDADAAVDMGAYEAQGYTWYVTFGDNQLEAGRGYRNGFHTSKTLASTLQAYDVQPFQQAEKAYSMALSSPDVPPGIGPADFFPRQLDTAWEINTGELMAGNDDLAKSLDVRLLDAGEVPNLTGQIVYQNNAWSHFKTAVDAYRSLLQVGGYFNLFLAEQPNRFSLLDLNNPAPPPNPYQDVQRLAEASAKESLAALSLAESYFRQYTPDSKAQAKQTLRAGYDRAAAQTALLSRLVAGWSAAQNDSAFVVAYQALNQNISDMGRIFSYLEEDKNPFGYHEGYVPFLIRYDNTGNPETVWNFENVYKEAYAKEATSYYNQAEASATALKNTVREMDDNQDKLNSALLNLEADYQTSLGGLCGYTGSEINLAYCNGGDIKNQVLTVESALTRFRQAQLKMANQLELVRIEQDRAATVAGIHKATAIMYEEDGTELVTLARDEIASKNYLSDGLNTGLDVLDAAISSFLAATSVASFDESGASYGFGSVSAAIALARGLVGALVPTDVTTRDPADIAARREEIDARQKARVEYAEAEIVDANSAALIKQYFLEFATLDLDRAIAYNALQQEINKLQAMSAQVEYLLAHWQEVKQDAAKIFLDPADRLYRDRLVENAQNDYDLAQEWAYLSARALDYEMGEPWLGENRLFQTVDLESLKIGFSQMYDTFNKWLLKSGGYEEAYTVIPLSRVMGFANSWEVKNGQPVYITARQKFKAYVSNPANWVDLDNNGSKDSLRLTFQTSIFNVDNAFNLFSTGVYNDKILRVAPVLIGDATHLDGNNDNTSIRIKQLGTCYLRDKNAVIGGQDSFSAYDFEHTSDETTSREARINSYHDWINTEHLARSTIDTSGSLGLLWRSVGCTNWVLTIAKEGIDVENNDINFAYLDDILLNIKHRNFALTTPASTAAVDEKATAPESQSPKLAAVPQFLATADAAYRYGGLLLPDNPQQLLTEIPAINIVLYLEQSSSQVAGAIEAGKLVSFPVNGTTGQGPALSGSVSSWLFSLTSEPYLGEGGVSRVLQMTTTKASADGAEISGTYVISIQGMAQGVIETSGTFTLTRYTSTPTAAFSAVSTAPVGSSVHFSNWSQGVITSYAWDFGDGTTSTEVAPVHVYRHPGTYTVSLRVESLYGSNTRTEVDFIIITNAHIYLPQVQR